MNEALAQPEVPHEGAVRDPEVLPRLLASLWRREWSGLVIVRSGDVERRLYLIDGRVQTAVSNDPAESLTAQLVARGALGSDDVGRAAVHLAAADRGLAFAKKLVGLGLVDQASVSEAEAQRVVSLAETVLTLRSGVYRCEVGPPPAEMVPQALDVPRLIATAVLGRWDETWAMNVLGGMAAVLRLRLERLPDYEATDADEAYDLTLLRVDGRTPLRELLAASPLPELAVVKFFAACRLLGVVEADEAAPAAPAREADRAAAKAAPPPPAVASPPRRASPSPGSPPDEEEGETTRPGFYRPGAGSQPRPRRAAAEEARPEASSGPSRALLIALLIALLGAVGWFGWLGLRSLASSRSAPTSSGAAP